MPIGGDPPRLLLLCLLLLSIVTGTQQAAAGNHSFLLVEDPWPPYTMGQAGETATDGLIVELIHELFSRVGQPVRLELHPWKRCIHMVKTNQADGLMLTVKTPERDRFSYFAEPFFVNKIQFYHRDSQAFSWETFSDLKGLTIGLVAGAKYSQEFQEAIERIPLRTETVPSIPLNFRKLQAGRIDLTPVLDVVAAKIISDNEGFSGQFAAASKPLRTTAMQMAIAKSSTLMKYSGDINQAIHMMKRDGTVDRIYRKYVPQVGKPSVQGAAMQ